MEKKLRCFNCECEYFNLISNPLGTEFHCKECKKVIYDSDFHKGGNFNKFYWENLG